MNAPTAAPPPEVVYGTEHQLRLAVANLTATANNAARCTHCPVAGDGDCRGGMPCCDQCDHRLPVGEVRLGLQEISDAVDALLREQR